MSVRIFGHHPYPARISLCLDERAWRQVTRRLEVAEPFPGAKSHGNVTTFTKNDAPDEIVISFDPKILVTRPRDEVVVLIAHECVHVMQRIEEGVGRRGDLGDEGQAYLVQSLLLWILGELPAGRRRRA